MATTGTLDAVARRAAMAEALARDGSLDLHESAATWQVHPMTIRRDFDALVAAGLARRVRGGVIAVRRDSFEGRRYRNAEAKRRIAAKLCALVPAGGTIGVDASTTAHEFALRISGVPGLSVVTNGLAAFEALGARADVTTYLTGGQREDETFSLVGSLAVLSLQQFTLDLSVVSTMSLDPAFGTSELTLEQVAVKRAMADASVAVVLALDSTKLEKRARFRSLPLAAFDALVTELDPGDPVLDPYRRSVPRIL